MARQKIIVETSRLKSTADQVDRLAESYENEYKALFGTVRDLQNAWSGTDNTAFTTQIEGFRDDFDRMVRLMRDYSAYLRKAADAYRATQENVASSAKTLSQGN